MSSVKAISGPERGGIRPAYAKTPRQHCIMEVIKESCYQLQPLVSCCCSFQKQALEFVVISTAFARRYLEHEGSGPPELTPETLEEGLQKTDPAEVARSRVSRSFGDRISNFSFERKKALLEDLDASVSVIASGLQEGSVFACVVGCHVQPMLSLHSI